MKNKQGIILVTLCFWMLMACNASKINQPVIEMALVSGNCEMCKKNIEKAGSQPKVSKVEWSVQNKIATITYNKNKTTKDEILKKIAEAGYSNENYKANKAVYNSLPACCKYVVEQSSKKQEEKPHDHDSHDHKQIYMAKATEIDAMKKNDFNWLFEGCYKLTTSLMQEDHDRTADLAGSIYRGINQMNDSLISENTKKTWNKFKYVIQSDASGIANGIEVNIQRNFLPRFSMNVFELMKTEKLSNNTYLQLCKFGEGSMHKSYYWISNSQSSYPNPYGFKDCGEVIDKIEVDLGK